MSPYRSYKEKSIGRLLHFLYYYLPFYMVEQVTLGGGSVNFWGESIATYRWEENNIPHFTFYGEHRESYTDLQKSKKTEAIQDLA